MTIDTITVQSHKHLLFTCENWMKRHRAFYLDAAKLIEPDLDDWTHVWDRLAFAILTANTEVGKAVHALHSVRKYRDIAWVPVRMPGITTERMEYVQALPIREHVMKLKRERGEDWHSYRLRIGYEVKGLAMTKATYAACLLYPREADVACLDVWMQRLLIPEGTERFRHLSDIEYVTMEETVRAFGKRVGLCTASAQWAMWDFVRNGVPSSQRFFD